ncbi:chemotaxis protein CheW [Chryseolinea soli]|uniref:Purine-binding chemotaxis protein CheW n=1 Tax=Chryseolinea soli TaxID=2321403 RepID=A0A385SK20_9BACT|nr:chemotaxis protein CheW [Chryseolinea soli]AYB29740.1 purine-binding chemotaxis protein CheW [Chryseolinea soli]
MKEDIHTEKQKIGSQRSLQIVVFKLGNEEYGLHIDQIKEVVITPTITRMPQTPSYVKGVANIRGNVIAIFDLEDRFNLSSTVQNQGNKYTLVVESEDVKLGLLVNEVPNTVSVNASDLDESVGIINDANAETNYIKGIIKAGHRLIILIDIFKVIDQELANTLKKTAVAA